jgi:hypothetical protein
MKALTKRELSILKNENKPVFDAEAEKYLENK